MTLPAEEYHDHLKTTAVRAGFSFDEVVLPSAKTVLVDKLRFRYLDWGNEELRPILFLHGGALTAHTWDLCCLPMPITRSLPNARTSGVLSIGWASIVLSWSACRWARSMRSPLRSAIRKDF